VAEEVFPICGFNKGRLKFELRLTISYLFAGDVAESVSHLVERSSRHAAFRPSLDPAFKAAIIALPVTDIDVSFAHGRLVYDGESRAQV
jgi:hypothetical protein